MPTVLIVEDDRAAREGLSQLLSAKGVDVTAADDGAEALARLDEQAFDLMLLDVWMPQISGLDLLERLHVKPSAPKVIVMTADDTPETLLMTLRRQAHQFVRKPVDPKALLDLVHHTVSSPAVEPAIIVLSARPAWIELLVSCGHEVADRIQSYIVNLDVDLPKEIRETMGTVFRELLLDAMEWDGHLDPSRKVRIAYLRGKKMLMYRIADAGSGFRSSDRRTPSPATAHAKANGAGNGAGASGLLRPGAVLARAQADDLLVNETRTEMAVVKYLN
jgi:CheY-like chemotaxis protein